MGHVPYNAGCTGVQAHLCCFSLGSIGSLDCLDIFDHRYYRPSIVLLCVLPIGTIVLWHTLLDYG